MTDGHLTAVLVKHDLRLQHLGFIHQERKEGSDRPGGGDDGSGSPESPKKNPRRLNLDGVFFVFQ